MSGNLCRCGAYVGIVEAIREAFEEGGGAMKNFAYTRAENVGSAIQSITQIHAKFLGGGTNLVDLMRENIEQPDHLVDLSALPLAH